VSLCLLVAVISRASAEGAGVPPCHPECRWQCDDPVCPAQCHPVCARPKCQMQCEELEAAKCTVECERPQCSVRCPKDMCEKNDCPQCETVCSPAQCRTTCVAPKPRCLPLCEETKCDWKCKKPTLCPKPKCELLCEKPACEAQDPVAPQQGGSGHCCQCNEQNLQAAIELADKKTSKTTEEDMHPSFMEIMHTTKFKKAEGEEMCCPCGSS